jgi:hypothetical protein
MSKLTKYDVACPLAEAKAVDEVKDIRDPAWRCGSTPRGPRIDSLRPTHARRAARRLNAFRCDLVPHPPGSQRIEATL